MARQQDTVRDKIILLRKKAATSALRRECVNGRAIYGGRADDLADVKESETPTCYTQFLRDMANGRLVTDSEFFKTING